MKELEGYIAQYLDICERQRSLAPKTVSAYRIDLRQLCDSLFARGGALSKEGISEFIADLNERYEPRSVKRKVASAKAFCRWLEDEELIGESPFRRLRVRLREPKTLPRTVPLRTIEEMLRFAHAFAEDGLGNEKARRDAAIMELLFATGIRVSELCRLNMEDVDLREGSIMIWGKGAKERLIQIGHLGVISTLKRYIRRRKCTGSDPFFMGRSGERITEQCVRRTLQRYGRLASEPMNVTPHMFRHSFATLLLEEDVDIRYIQRMLGHTSIMTTQIYTSVATSKQKAILTNRHPRNRISV